MEPDAAATALQMLRDYFAPDALTMVNQDAARFLQFERTPQLRGEDLVTFDSLRRKGKSLTQIDGAFPEAFVPVLRRQINRGPWEAYRGVWGSLRWYDGWSDYVATREAVNGGTCRSRRRMRGSPSIPRTRTISKRGRRNEITKSAR